MKFGADDRSNLKNPPTQEVLWIGHKKEDSDSLKRKAFVKAKLWYTARRLVARHFSVSEMDVEVIQAQTQDEGQETNNKVPEKPVTKSSRGRKNSSARSHRETRRKNSKKPS